ncbi:MAG: response regulator [Actinomycetota bacterium]
MPRRRGPRAAREIIRLSPATRVIALSAFEDKPTVLEMLRAGAVGYLVKGAAADRIIGSIAKVVDVAGELSAEVIDAIVDRAAVAAPPRGDRAGAARRTSPGDRAVRRGRGRHDGLPADRRPAHPRGHGDGGALAVPFAAAPPPPYEWFAEAAGT